ncbi:hypothetical protein HpKG73_17760 [Helicobacter pylori]
MDTTKENLNGSKERLSYTEYNRDFYMVLLTIPFGIAMHEISAYCGHTSNFFVEGLVILVFQYFLKLCTKWGW